jgi:glycosyltransferase involved in cell wall biosynthesis
LQNYYLERFGWNSGPKLCAALAVFHYLRLWDTRTSNGVDLMLCNSDYVRRRILKTYRRPAFVVYPPIDTERFGLQEKKQDFYLTGSFMNPFKRIDLVVQAFAKLPNRRLVVFGEGPDMPRIRSLAGPNVVFVGRLSNERLVEYLQSARAFVFGAPEDFGMIMAEAQSCGTPVLAYAEGGASEIVRDLDTKYPTGALYAEQTPESLLECVQRFERATTIAPESCRANVMRFSTPQFHSRLGHILDVSWFHWTRSEWPVHEEQLYPLFADAQFEAHVGRNQSLNCQTSRS